jgi:hypothetical protein
MDTQNYLSVGRIASELGCVPDIVRLAASDLGIEPALVLNHVQHFSPDQIRRIAAIVGQTASLELARRSSNLH